MSAVKTAISLQRDLYQQVNRIAQEQKIPRSRVFVLALEAYVTQYQNRLLLEQLNNAYASEPDASEQKRLKAARRIHRRIVEGEW